MKSPPSANTSAFVELMRTTITLSQNLNCSPFEIFEQDVDEVIMLINFYLILGDEKGEQKTNTTKHSKETRIRVNDKTATGGWF